MSNTASEAKSSQTKPSIKRARFLRYCVYAANGATARAAKRGLPCNIDAHAIDRLLVDQRWRCAVSGIALVEPAGGSEPFGPSLDRIVPSLGYVPGNVRVVCNLVNFAMNRWGEDPLRKLIAALRTRTGQRRPRWPRTAR